TSESVTEPVEVEEAKGIVKDAPKEMVRVSSALLEKLVNLAGESSILRSRVEQTIGDFGQALGEMDITISRLRDQLRRMEIETETQVLFRTELEGTEHETFDPLEMDRYSRMQEIARTLSESTSDMFELKDTLRVKARDSETLLIQQARLNTELQEGLMHTRMVPFGRMLPRLKRIVRQVSQEVGKVVELHALNAEGELDRNIIERIIPPLEHLLRNAIDHGLESAQERELLGKPASGRIEISLLREAGDVVLEVSDDGRGIDTAVVRSKAIERGLMRSDASLSEEEVLQFILAPGFSTAESVTQLSGRGVGMDVVQSEVKRLGGNIEITSSRGKGTRITLRLPFTVSVNRALMVLVGDDQYAIPLNNIEGIVRIPVSEFQQMNEPDSQTFEYAGIPYRLRYLGNYLGREFSVKPDQASVPVVLVRSGDRAMALYINSVQGSREIIVKSLGQQFAGVGGLSGATILGDGSVVVILDVISLIAGHRAETKISIPEVDEEETQNRCVMVVDDSVTVRKVTSRILERQGMDVIVAKDGVEAMELLQEKCPDVMLLDIEMPRMDGFEVARQIRHDATVSNLPIIMISSRTGAKHQEHAGALGVNKFLGKPFQESELLTTIDELLVAARPQRGLVE
ncbi:MAG: response regulator, partial [Pseudomonadales bacterium]|nr:response regulator [Pseudomonadales bacterium]